jgi:hypothetical protein
VSLPTRSLLRSPEVDPDRDTFAGHSLRLVTLERSAPPAASWPAPVQRSRRAAPLRPLPLEPLRHRPARTSPASPPDWPAGATRALATEPPGRPHDLQARRSPSDSSRDGLRAACPRTDWPPASLPCTAGPPFSPVITPTSAPARPRSTPPTQHLEGGSDEWASGGQSAWQKAPEVIGTKPEASGHASRRREQPGPIQGKKGG